MRDQELVKETKEGNKAALEELIKRHQGWIYNLAFRMTGNRYNAEDVSQEIIVKMITKLSSYKGQSNFRTWLYRIVTNHVLNMKRKRKEYIFSSPGRHAELIDNTSFLEPPDPKSLPVDTKLLVEETKMQCLSGMILCLERRERLVFTLGAVLGVDSKTGAERMNMSSENFRKILQRDRQNIGNYISDKCGLINRKSLCRCRRKVRALLKIGYMNPDRLEFCAGIVETARKAVKKSMLIQDELTDLKWLSHFRNWPEYKSPDYAAELDAILEHKGLKNLIDFDLGVENEN